MTLLDAQQYDPARERRRRIRIIGAVAVVLLLGALGWAYRYWPEEHMVDRFFGALQEKNYEAAYGIWWHDPDWRRRQDAYARYSFSDFYTDWGPGGEWGVINSYKVFGAGTPPGASSGVVVEVVVNGRAEHARVWVEKSDKRLSFSPY